MNFVGKNYNEEVSTPSSSAETSSKGEVVRAGPDAAADLQGAPGEGSHLRG